MSAVTRKVSEDLARRLGERKFDMWFGPSTRIRIDGSRLEVIADSKYVAEWIDAHFSKDLHDAARQAMGVEASVMITVDDRPDRSGRRKRAPAASIDARPRAAAATPTTSSVASPAPVVRPPATRPDPSMPLRHRLDTFVVGESNKLAFRAATHLAEVANDGGLGPVFIYGECGLGKTHLLQGACRRFIEAHPGAHMRYTTGEQFTNEFIHALQKGSIEQFRARVRGLWDPLESTCRHASLSIL